jgi:hypothetical protein
MLVFNRYFYKNKKLKLYFGDRVAVLNEFIYQTGGVITRRGFSYIQNAFILKKLIAYLDRT